MSSRSTQIIGGEGRQRAHVDGIDNGLAGINEIHFNIHRGIVFTATNTALAVANDGSMNVLIVVANGTHLRFKIGIEGQAQISFFEGTAVSANGTAVAANNRNRFSSNAATTTIFHTPTITDDGTVLASGFAPGGTGGTASGHASSPVEEWILAPGNYMLRITNTSSTTSDLTTTLEFYEPGLIS